MNHLGLLLLGSPLSVWALLASYHGLVSPTASLKSRVFALGLVALTFKINASLLRSYLFTRRARALGCGEVTDLRVKDPILGLDAFFKTVAALNSFRLMPYYNKLFSTIGQTHAQILLGRRVLMTNEPENIKAILATHMDEWPIDGPRLYSMLPLLGPYSIFTSNGQAWHETRALIRPSFVRDQVADFACFDRHIGNLLANIPLDGTTFDMQHLLLKMTMDSSTDFMLGHSTNSLVSSSPEADQFLRDFEYASDVATKRARLGLLLSYFPNKKLDDSVRRLKAYLHFYLKKVVAEKEAGKRDTGSKSYVFLDELLKLDIPEEQIIGHILSVVVAGRDTTAGALSAVFYCLARSPDVVAKLRREIDEVGEEKPSWEQLKQMKYLNNVIREALRLFPPVSTNSRTAHKETLLPRGGGPDGNKPILVPKGTPVRWSLYSLHRRKDIYGEDAHEFKPERWEKLRVGWEYIPFHGGPRICLGQQFALTQMSYTVYRFFRKFQRLEARGRRDTSDSPGAAMDPLLRTSITLSFAEGCLVKAVPA